MTISTRADCALHASCWSWRRFGPKIAFSILEPGWPVPPGCSLPTLGCRVDCLELSPDFCAGAVLLNRLTGLDDRIEVHKGSALDLPFPDDSFDVVWMQNVGMNIADKRKLYGEIYRVLKPGGRYAFQEMAAGEAATSYFPLPWATDPADSFLVSAEETRSVLGESGFIAELFEDTSDAHLSRTHRRRRTGSADLGGVRRQSRAKGRERAAQSSGGPDPACQRCLPGEIIVGRLRLWSSKDCRMKSIAARLLTALSAAFIATACGDAPSPAKGEIAQE